MPTACEYNNFIWHTTMVSIMAYPWRKLFVCYIAYYNGFFLFPKTNYTDVLLFIFAGVMYSSLVAEITDGASNVREVWKLSFK